MKRKLIWVVLSMVICFSVIGLVGNDFSHAAAESADLNSVLSALLGEAEQSVPELTATYAALKDEIEALVPGGEPLWDENTTIKILYNDPLIYQLSTSHINCSETMYSACGKTTYVKDKDGVQELLYARRACETFMEVLSCAQEGETKMIITVGYKEEDAWDFDLDTSYTKEYTIIHGFEKEDGEWQEISLLHTFLDEAEKGESIPPAMMPSMVHALTLLVSENDMWGWWGDAEWDEDTTIKILNNHPLIYQLSTRHINCSETRYSACRKTTYIKDEDGVQELLYARRACETFMEVLSCAQEDETKMIITVGYKEEDAWDFDLDTSYTKEYTIIHGFEKEDGEWQEISLLPTFLDEAAQGEPIPPAMMPSMVHALTLLMSEEDMWGWWGDPEIVIHYAKPPVYLLSMQSGSCQEPLFILEEDGLQYLMGIGSDCGPVSHEILSIVQDSATKITITVLSTLEYYGIEESINIHCFEKEDGKWQEVENRMLSEVFYPYYDADIPAQLNQSMPTRTGPGAMYTEDLGTLPEDTEIVVLRQEMGGGIPWGHVEFMLDGMYYRAYTEMERMDADDEPPWAEEPQTVQVIEDVTPYYGPGTYFAPFKHTLQAGVWVEVYGREGDYALVDYLSPDEPDKRVRSWVPLRVLEGYEPPHIVRYPIEEEE